MTTAPGSPAAAEPHRQPPAGQEFGGEVRIGGGGGPGWLRWLRYWYYLVYAWAILYLVIEPRFGQYWLDVVFAGLLVVWLVYIWWKKKPPEP